MVRMATAGYCGLLFAYLAGTLNLLYLSRVGDPALVSGVGSAAIIFFFAIAANIGLSTSVSALIARAAGAGVLHERQTLPVAVIIIACAMATAVSALLWFCREGLLARLGITGAALQAGELYLRLLLPTNLLLAFAMTATAAIRAIGDARLAMKITLTGALVSIVLDPIMIWQFRWGIEGAALSNWLGRFFHCYIAYQALAGAGMIARPTGRDILRWSNAVAAIAIPASMAALAVPAGSSLLLRVIAPYGDQPTAEYLIVDKINTVCFGPLIAVAGAIGPIVAQNFSAGLLHRVYQTIFVSIGAVTVYIIIIGTVSFLCPDRLLSLFLTSQPAFSEVGVTFLQLSGLIWLFYAFQIVASAVFQNLGRAYWSAILSWAQATVGFLPAWWLARQLNSPVGTIYGYLISSILFGLLSLLMLARLLRPMRHASGPGRAGCASGEILPLE